MKAQVNGITINYEVSGTEGKPWITFSHALCNNLTLWDDQAELLKDDYRILRYDHRGLGQSEAPEGPYTFPMIIADALALMDHVGVDKTHWCGLSIGGMMGYGLAQDHGELLCLLASCVGGEELVRQIRVVLARPPLPDSLITKTRERRQDVDRRVDALSV